MFTATVRRMSTINDTGSLITYGTVEKATRKAIILYHGERFSS